MSNLIQTTKHTQTLVNMFPMNTYVSVHILLNKLYVMYDFNDRNFQNMQKIMKVKSQRIQLTRLF